MTKTFLQWISSKPLKVVLQTRNHKKKKNETKQKQKASRRNNDNDVGIFAMLKYGRNEKNDVLHFNWSRTTKAIWGHLYFH